jgi:phage repressor protein C with HTH and peptisase S24 domain
MSTLWGKNIAHLMALRGISGAELARAIDVKNPSVNGWLHGKTHDIAGTNLIKVAEFFGVSAEAIMEQDLTGLSAAEELGRYETAIAVKRVPVVGSAQLGDDGYWHELEYPVGVGDGYVEFPTRDANAYAVRVEGDSMRPRYKPGEFVIVEPNRGVEPGHEVLVRTTDGRAMVKVLDWKRGNLVQLSSINEDHRPITLTAQNVVSMHRVMGGVQADLHKY